MIRLLLATSITWLFGASVYAQTIVVRSGEHDNFSRLVLPIPGEIEWEIVKSRKSFSLKVSSPTVVFDFSQVFERIPRKRLFAISQEGAGSELVFSLSCECSVTSFSDNPRFIVIDIKDEDQKQERRQQVYGSLINHGTYRFTKSVAKGKQNGPSNAILPVVFGQIIERGPPEAIGSISPHLEERQYSPISFSEQRLLAQIERATAQGLLEQKAGREPAGTDQQGSSGTSTPAEKVEEAVPIPLSVTTAIDRDLAGNTALISLSQPSKKCVDPAYIAIGSWGRGENFSAEISLLRSRLYGEFDKLQPKVAADMVRYYLFLGFGAEARQVIDLSMKDDNESRIMRALAEILDATETAFENPFAGQQSCKGDAALWSLVSEETVSPNVDSDAVLKSFARLPLHLRERFGPEISRKYVEIGNGQMANTILRITSRAASEPISGYDFAEATVAGLNGDTESEEKALMNSVADGNEYSPRALVEIISKRFGSRETLTPDIPDLVAAYATEFRGTDIESELLRTQVVALALTDRFGEAISAYETMRMKAVEEDSRAALTALFVLMSERADDVTFLRHAIDLKKSDSEFLQSQVREQVAERLLDLGFPDEAENWLKAPGEVSNSEKRRLMQAEIEVARDQPHRALVELIGFNEPKANRLRAMALRQNGEYLQVGQVLTAVQDLDGAARAFWLAENWDDVPEQAETHYAQIVEQSTLLFQKDSGLELLTPLARARSLMQGSTETRGIIAALLQKVSTRSEMAQ